MATRSILLVSYFAPCRGHAGGLRLLDLYRQIRQLRPQVNLELVTCRHPEVDWGCESVDEIFNRVHWLSPKEFRMDSIEELGVLKFSFDVVDLQYHQAGALIGGVRRKSPGSLIIFSPMESMIRAAKLYFQGGLNRFSFRRYGGYLWLALQEAYHVMLADRVVCVSDPDRRALLPLKRSKDVFCLPTGLSPFEFSNDCGRSSPGNGQSVGTRKKTLVFAAYFGSQTNRDALIWFIRSVHPLVRDSVPDYVLNVVGRGADAELISYCRAEGINFIGEVASIVNELRSVCGGIAPALTGAGVRGKIHQYASLGLPCVATRIAAAGLKYEPGKSILLADDAIDFSKQCLTLLLDESSRTMIGHEARRVCLENYSWQTMDSDVLNIYNLEVF